MRLLIIDDDPEVGLTIAELFPDAQVNCATDGLAGLALAQELGDAVDLVLLDIRMEYNGLHVAARLRRELPGLRILPHSHVTDSGDLLRDLGIAAPLLAKPASHARLRAAVLAALALPPPQPLPDDRWLKNLYKQALLQAEELSEKPAIAVLSLSNLLGRCLLVALKDCGQPSYLLANPQRLAARFARRPPSLLVAEPGRQRLALHLSERYGVPLLYISLTIAEGVRAQTFCQHIIVSPDTPRQLTTAISQIAEGKPYVDPLIGQRLRQLRLTPRDQDILPWLLQDSKNDVIAERLQVAVATVHNYKWRVFDELGCATVGELVDRINDDV